MSSNLNAWLHPRAFWMGAAFMAAVQLSKLLRSGITPEFIGYSVGSIVGGGFFLGVIGTYIFNRSRNGYSQNNNERVVKYQNIIGVVLVFFGSILLWYFTTYGYGNYAAYLGQAAGRSAVFLLIALLLLAITPLRKMTSIILVAGIVWLGSVATLSHDLYKKGVSERESGRAIIGLLDSISNGEDISSESSATTNESVESWMKDYMGKVQSIHIELSNEIAAADLASMLAPENLVNIETTNQSRSIIINLDSSVAGYEQKLIEELNNAEKIIASRKDGASQAAHKGFLETKEHGIQLTKEYFDIERNIIGAIGDILDLSIKNHEKLHLQDGQLLFEDQETLDLYNSKVMRITSLSEQEEKLIMEQQQRIDKVKSEINESL